MVQPVLKGSPYFDETGGLLFDLQVTGDQAETASEWVRNYLQVVNMEVTTLARACGKSDVHHLEREDLAALTVEAAAMARVPLAGTSWIPGA